MEVRYSKEVQDSINRWNNEIEKRMQQLTAINTDPFSNFYFHHPDTEKRVRMIREDPVIKCYQNNILNIIRFSTPQLIIDKSEAEKLNFIWGIK